MKVDLYLNNQKIKRNKILNFILILIVEKKFWNVKRLKNLCQMVEIYGCGIEKKAQCKILINLLYLKIIIFLWEIIRDCSKDSRFLSSVGYVNFNNLVGKAQIIFFSNDKKKGIFFKFWKWNESLSIDRFFKKIQ